jgi:NodT family efflux transporter outer membrane factor (OMF) lipoprotein
MPHPTGHGVPVPKPARLKVDIRSRFRHPFERLFMRFLSLLPHVGFGVVPVATVLLSGCMVVGTNYSSPDMITPDSWHQSLSSDLSSGSSSLDSWWREFNDPTLNRLIQTARDSNRDLAIAYERINEARSSLGISRSQLFPTVDFNGAINRRRGSENLGNPSPPAGKTIDVYSTGLTAGWEIDVFGGVRRSIEASNATVEGAEELYRDVMVSLLADVALGYIEVRTFEKRIAVARKNLTAQRSSLELTTARLEAGLSPELDVEQAKTNLATTEAIIPQLQNGRNLAVNRLAVLLGKYSSAAENLLQGSKGIPGTGFGFRRHSRQSDPVET